MPLVLGIHGTGKAMDTLVAGDEQPRNSVLTTETKNDYPHGLSSLLLGRYGCSSPSTKVLHVKAISVEQKQWLFSIFKVLNFKMDCILAK